jgi:hypothetical protein
MDVKKNECNNVYQIFSFHIENKLFVFSYEVIIEALEIFLRLIVYEKYF